MVTWQPAEIGNAVEGFALETTAGLIFTVKGLVHPPARLIAYLRYLPEARGDRQRGSGFYRRVYRFQEQCAILKNRFPHYLGFDSAFGMELQSVPRQDIRQIYDPCQRLAQMREHGPADSLQRGAVAFTNLLSHVAGVPLQNLGISGSLLLGLQLDTSDLDVVVYGEREAYAVHEALGRLLAAPRGPVRKLDRESLAALHASHRPDTPLSFGAFARLQSRKVNEGYFERFPYFIRFVKRPEEVPESYGDPCFESLGRVTIECRVSDHRDAIFTPCRYEIENVVFLDGKPAHDLREVISFRGRFSDQVRAGERAIAKGRLERVTSAAGKVYHRIAVGGQAGDYLSSNEESACKPLRKAE